MPAVGGFVFDSSGAPVDREIRLYRRDTGEFLGKTRSSGGDGDPHFDKVALLLHMDGADGSTTFTDSSPQPSTITSVGGLALSSAQAKFGVSSLKFINDSAKYITAPAAKFAFLTDLTTSYTVEAWLYPTAAKLENILNLGQNYNIGAFFAAMQNADLKVSAAVNRSSGTYGGFSGVSATAMTLNAWNHVAVCYDAVTQKIQVFVNGIGGTAVTKAAGTYGDQTEYPLTFGRYANVYTSAWESSAYHDEVRITKGVARYTADFTPPAAPFPDIPSPGRTMPLGEYYFATNYTGEVQVVCVDDASEPLENDLILRTFPV